MDSNRLHPAFASFSSFTLKPLASPTRNVNNASISERHHRPTMVSPQHVRRTEEIKRLTKQLEQLRAVRDQMQKKPSSPRSTAVPKSPTEAPPAPPAPPVKPQTSSEPASAIKFGKHSENSRFLSVTDFSTEEFLPRILPVAGPVPGLTVAELDAIPRMEHSKPPKAGNIYVTKVPDGYRGGLITAPMTSNISDYADPVALQVQPNELSAAQLPCADDDYVYAILDRATGDVPFDNAKFYAWDVDGMVKVGWLKEKPAPHQVRCLGRVALGVLEIREELRKKRSCWEEENETYM